MARILFIIALVASLGVLTSYFTSSQSAVPTEKVALADQQVQLNQAFDSQQAKCEPVGSGPLTDARWTECQKAISAFTQTVQSVTAEVNRVNPNPQLTAEIDELTRTINDILRQIESLQS